MLFETYLNNFLNSITDDNKYAMRQQVSVNTYNNVRILYSEDEALTFIKQASQRLIELGIPPLQETTLLIKENTYDLRGN